MKPRQFFSLLKEAGASWSEDRAPSMGAAISYYSVFSLAPLLVIIIAVAGLFFGTDQVQGALFAQLSSLMGDEAAKAVDEMLKHAQEPKTGGIAAGISIFVLIVGATTVLAELQSALDRIWKVPESEKPQGNAVWIWLRQRLLTFGMVLALAFLLIISLVFSAALATLGKWWGPMFGAWETVAHLVDLALSFGLLTLAFAAIYKLMPSTHIPWRDVWVGAAVTSLLFTVGKWAIGLYLGKSDVASSFGLFGSLALMMIWVYYSGQIFLFGAEFTWVYANRYGSRSEKAAAEASVGDAPVIPVLPVAANDPAPPAAERRPSRVKRYFPELAFGGAFLVGAALAKLVPSGLRVFRRKLPHH